MNKLSYKVIDSKEKIAQSCPDFRIVLDGKETTHFFDIDELERSGKSLGTYAIVVCACGETGCSGAEVEVAHQNNEILWKKVWHTDWDREGKEHEKREFSFDENKIGHPDIKKELPLKFDKEEYRTLVLNLTSHDKK